MENLNWKKVANWDNEKLWTDLISFMDAAWNAGYLYGLFNDGVVYTIDPKTGLVSETGWTESDIV